MKDQVLFVLMLMALGWGFYNSWKTKNDGLFYALIYCGILFSVKYPFYVPFGFALSFVGFFGFGVLLYKALQPKLERSLIVFAMLLLVSAIVFLWQGFWSPVRTQLWVVAEFVFGISLFLGFGVFLYRIWRRKLERSLIIFDLSLFVFGFVFFSQALFFIGACSWSVTN